MKLNKIATVVLAAAALLSAQSCLKDQKDVFPESSSERLQAYLDKAKQILTESETGWIMEYYPGAGQKLGGYAYYLKFTGTEVETVCELDPEHSYKSLYKFTTDNGAVLSFDAYNSALHYFATPSSGEYQAKGGDFEFTITSVSEDKIGLVGKRSGNHYDLYPYDSELAPKDYMLKVNEMAAGMRAAIINGDVGETRVSGTVDFDNRRIKFSYKEGKSDVVVEAPYMYTPDGLKPYEPVTVAGYKIDHLFYFSSTNLMTTGSIVFVGSLPADYTEYAAFAGNYTLSCYGGKIRFDVTLKRDAAGTGYLMSGLVPGHDVALSYDSARGRLSLTVQVVGANGANTVWLAAWGLADGGNLTWAEGPGMEIVRDATTGNFNFVDNGFSSELKVDSFILWETTASGSNVGEFTGWNTSEGDDQFPYLESLIRK